MRFFLFLILVILAAPFAGVVHEALAVFVRPDRFAPLIGLDAGFDAIARVAVSGMAGAFFAMLGWVLVSRPKEKAAVAPGFVSASVEAKHVRAERDYWRAVVSELLAAQNVSADDRDRLLSTIRKKLAAHEQADEKNQPKRSLVAER